MDKIHFINHASLLFKSKRKNFLCDPWYISPAFGGWTQEPSPSFESILHVLKLDNKLNIIISHGHDDHIDEFFIKKHLKNSQFIIPKYKSPGLRKRISNLTGKEPIELSEDSLCIDGVEIAAFINPEFSNNDAIVVFKNTNTAIIHANDNYHEWPKDLTNKIKSFISSQPNKLLFVQFGIADCFPINYVPFDFEKTKLIIQSRFTNYKKTTEKNYFGVGASEGYYYANQSNQCYPASWQGESLYNLAQSFLQVQNQSPFKQLLPGTIINKSKLIYEEKLDLFTGLLKLLEIFINSEIRVKKYYINLIYDEGDYKKNTIAYLTSKIHWSKILTGEITMEAITIGGIGKIYKPNINISLIHHQISKLSYLIQSKIREQGLNFLLDLKNQ